MVRRWIPRDYLVKHINSILILVAGWVLAVVWLHIFNIERWVLPIHVIAVPPLVLYWRNLWVFIQICWSWGGESFRMKITSTRLSNLVVILLSIWIFTFPLPLKHDASFRCSTLVRLPINLLRLKISILSYERNHSRMGGHLRPVPIFDLLALSGYLWVITIYLDLVIWSHHTKLILHKKLIRCLLGFQMLEVLFSIYIFNFSLWHRFILSFYKLVLLVDRKYRWLFNIRGQPLLRLILVSTKSRRPYLFSHKLPYLRDNIWFGLNLLANFWTIWCILPLPVAFEHVYGRFNFRPRKLVNFIHFYLPPGSISFVVRPLYRFFRRNLSVDYVLWRGSWFLI